MATGDGPPWYIRLQAEAQRLAKRWLRRAEDVEEVTQDALARAIEEGEDLHADDGSMEKKIRTYVRTEVRRRWRLDERGLEAGDSRLEDEELKPETIGRLALDPERALRSARRLALLQHCLDQLSDVHRHVAEGTMIGLTDRELTASLKAAGLAQSDNPKAIYPKKRSARALLAKCMGTALVERSSP